MTSAFDLAVRLADEIDQFPLGECGPSDDLDKQYAYCAAFRDISKRFVAAVKRIGNPGLSPLVAELNVSPELISEAHDLRADLYVAIDALREAAVDPDYAATAEKSGFFLDLELLLRLKKIPAKNLDPKKLVRICEELNDAYARANFISASLLLRAAINHVPAVFGVDTFAQVVSQSGRSIKAILGSLNDEARPIADLHNHLLMRQHEHLPTRNQLEPYKAAFEILIQEVISTLSET